MTKQEIIEALVDDDTNTIIAMHTCDDDTEYLASILRNGFKGYKHFTLSELKSEYSIRKS